MYCLLPRLYRPASPAKRQSHQLSKFSFLFLNLPGWRWGSITQNPLVAVSRPLHSGVCETRQDIGLPVLHSEISDSGLLRTRGDQQKITTRKTRRCPVLCFSKSVFVVVSYVFVFMPSCLPVFMLERLSFKNKRRSSSSWGMNQSTHPSLHRSHFGSRYQSGRCALRSPFVEPGSFGSR